MRGYAAASAGVREFWHPHPCRSLQWRVVGRVRGTWRVPASQVTDHVRLRHDAHACDCGTTLMRCNSFMHSRVPAMKQEKPAPCFSAVRAPSTSAGAAIYAAFHYLESTRPTAWTPRKSPREQARKTAAQSRPAQRAKRPKCYRVYSNVSGIKAVMGACAIDGEADCSTLCPGGNAAQETIAEKAKRAGA